MYNIYMKYLNKTFLLIIISFLVPTFVFADCTSKLNRNLKLGLKGEDVKILQKFLNENPTTSISKTGVNSKGKENGIFDSATQKAFKIFQQKNSSIILKPAGLTVPNGFVGANSRKIINEALCSDEYDLVTSSSTIDERVKNFKNTVSDTEKKFDELQLKLNSNKGAFNAIMAKIESLRNSVNKITDGALTIEDLVKKVSVEFSKTTTTPSESKKVEISSILPTDINVGDKIYLIGRNFQSTNKLYIGNNVVAANKATSSDNYLSINIPTSIAKGVYDLYIENSLGRSEKVKINIGGASSISTVRPEIISISPDKGNVGTNITIKGKNFTKTNTIYTTTKSFTGISSEDGSTLNITLGADSSILLSTGKLMTTLPFSIFVRNENGDSNYVIFKLE